MLLSASSFCHDFLFSIFCVCSFSMHQQSTNFLEYNTLKVFVKTKRKVFKHRWRYFVAPACNQLQRCFFESSSSSLNRNCWSSGSRGRCTKFFAVDDSVVVAVVVVVDVVERGGGGRDEVRFHRWSCECCSGCSWRRSDLVANFPIKRNKYERMNKI
jgi:hypothetical protein